MYKLIVTDEFGRQLICILFYNLILNKKKIKKIEKKINGKVIDEKPES